jgi:hypothetical protein
MGLTIDDKNINTDLNKYGEKITVINDGEDDDDDKETPISLRGSFMLGIMSTMTFFIVFLLSSIILNFSLFKYYHYSTKRDGDGDPKNIEGYHNAFLPTEKIYSPYCSTISGGSYSCNNDTEGNNWFRLTNTTIFNYPKGISGENIDPKNTHGVFNTLKNLYVESVMFFRIFFNFIFKFIFWATCKREDMDDGSNPKNPKYILGWYWTYFFSLIIIPILLFILPTVIFPIASVCSFIGILKAFWCKATHTSWNWEHVAGFCYLLFYLFVLLPIFTIPISFALILNLIGAVVYSLGNKLEEFNNVTFKDNSKFSIWNNFSTYLPYNLLIAVILFFVPFIGRITSDSFKSNNTSLSNMAVIVSILTVSVISGTIAYVIKRM